MQLHLLRYFLMPFSELLVGQDTAPLQSITKGNPRTWEFGRSWSLIVILLSHHEVPWITCPPLLAYVINPPNLRFVRLSKLISGIGLRNLMWVTLFRFGMPWTALTQTESITSRFKLEVLKRIFQNRNFIQKFSSRVYCTFKEPRRKKEHFCTKHSDYLAKMRGQLRELSHLLWRPSNLADRSKSNVSNFGRLLSLSLPFNSKGEIRISPIKQQFISLRRSTESFRTIIDYEHLRVDKFPVFHDRPVSGKDWSYAQECGLWGFQSTNHFSTQNEWNIHYKATERGDKIKMEKKNI